MPGSDAIRAYAIQMFGGAQSADQTPDQTYVSGVSAGSAGSSHQRFSPGADDTTSSAAAGGGGVVDGALTEAEMANVASNTHERHERQERQKSNTSTSVQRSTSVPSSSSAEGENQAEDTAKTSSTASPIKRAGNASPEPGSGGSGMKPRSSFQSSMRRSSRESGGSRGSSGGRSLSFSFSPGRAEGETTALPPTGVVTHRCFRSELTESQLLGILKTKMKPL